MIILMERYAIWFEENRQEILEDERRETSKRFPHKTFILPFYQHNNRIQLYP